MSKITISDLKKYIISEAKKLYKIEFLKEEKSKIISELGVIDEISPELKYSAFKKAADYVEKTPSQDSDTLHYTKRNVQGDKFASHISPGLQDELNKIATGFGENYEGFLKKGVHGIDHEPYVAIYFGPKSENLMNGYSISIVVTKDSAKVVKREEQIPQHVQRRLMTFIKKLQSLELPNKDRANNELEENNFDDLDIDSRGVEYGINPYGDNQTHQLPPSVLDGKTKEQAISAIIKTFKRLDRGQLYKDKSWENVHAIFKLFDQEGYDIDHIKSEYNPGGINVDSMTPQWKKYFFNVVFKNKDGNEVKFPWVLTASAAGDQVDPWSAYDLNLYPIAGLQKTGVNEASSLKLEKDMVILELKNLNEGIVREALKLQHDKEQNKLIVVSDLDGKAANQETFKNKALLKQNGFIWTGNHWAIPVDKFEIAKKTLSTANKVEYIINSLEDVEEAVMAADADNKSLLKSKLDQYISDLANATDEAALSAEIRRYLTFFSKFHNYSFFNKILIYIQKPDATRVASFNTWKSKFRQVQKGAKGITILAPLISKQKDVADVDNSVDGNALNNEKSIRGFKAVNVFDISDTLPIDERGEIPEEPKWWGENTPSETADKLYVAVVEVAKDMHINVTQNNAMGGEKGYSAGDHINISSGVSGVGRLSTMIHEIAHELMHHRSSSIYYQGDEIKYNSEIKELQAESVSYVVLKHYDLPVSHHATYLALWKANKEQIQKNLEVISKVSEFIIKKIDEEAVGVTVNLPNVAE